MFDRIVVCQRAKYKLGKICRKSYLTSTCRLIASCIYALGTLHVTTTIIIFPTRKYQRNIDTLLANLICCKIFIFTLSVSLTLVTISTLLVYLKYFYYFI